MPRMVVALTDPFHRVGNRTFRKLRAREFRCHSLHRSSAAADERCRLVPYVSWRRSPLSRKIWRYLTFDSSERKLIPIRASQLGRAFLMSLVIWRVSLSESWRYSPAKYSLPLLPGGELSASLEGEELLGLEFLWTEIGD